MKERPSKVIQAAVFLLTLAGVFYSISQACVFVGVAKVSPSMTEDTLHGCFEYMRLKTATDQSGTNCHWSVFGYGSDPATVVYHYRDSLSQPWSDSTGFHNKVHDAFVAGSDIFLSHARQLGGTHPEYYQCGRRGPHPFAYWNDTTEYGGYINSTRSYRTYGLKGKPYSFLHNGTVQVQTLMSSLGVGFGALDMFHDRYFSYWNRNGNSGSDRRIDTEHYAMAIMKNLMGQYNYYWDSLGVPANNPRPADSISSMEEWALRKTISGLTYDATLNPSMNGIFTDGATMWAVAKSDGRVPHTVGYRVADGTGYCRVIQSDICTGDGPTGCDGNFIRLNESLNSHAGQILCMPSDPAVTPFGHNMHTSEPSFPKELRVNARGFSTGNQVSPAIALDSARGCFTAVWVSNNAIVGRWYNQMGMAENDEFVIDNVDPLAKKGQPMAAISTDGMEMTVVWLEGDHDPSPLLTTYGFTSVRQRVYLWDNNNHAWAESGTAMTVGGSTCSFVGSADQLRHPSIAYARPGTSDHGYHAVTWEQCCNGNIIRVRSLLSNTFHYASATTVSTNGQEPDIAFMSPDKYVIVFGGPAIHVNAALYYENTGGCTTPTSLGTVNGQHPAVARRNATQFLAAFCDGQVKVYQCTIGAGDAISLDGTITSPNPQTSDNTMRPDIAVPATDGQFYVCFDTTNGSNRNICCMRYNGSAISRQEAVNQFTTGDQQYPVIAIAPSYPSWGQFYHNKASTSGGYRFEVRRMILWQTDGQDGDGWGIAGKFSGINGGIELPWYSPDPWQDGGSLVLTGIIAESATLSEPSYELDGEVVVPAGVTLTISSGVSIQGDYQATLKVAGTLIADGCTFTAIDPGLRWSGIYVTGTATIRNSTIENADIAVQEQDAAGLTVDACTVKKNRIGIYVYEPKNGKPQITNCVIQSNDAEGISLFSTYDATISGCSNISSNGTDGILLNSSYATISRCYFNANNGYGVNCYKSSPTLYCNSFEENKTGEMYLLNNSYPVLWTTNGVNGGSNTFVGTDHTLITMTDSYPVVQDGTNSFTIYGTKGYYMADMSASVPKHMVQNNDWNSNPPPANTFMPSDYAFWVWSPTKANSGCGGLKESSSNAAQALFEQGYTAEMAGNTATATSAYSQAISQYPDSCWAQLAAARMFENQRQVESAFAELRTYYDSLVTLHASDTCLVWTARDLATRTFVEQALYDQAITTYEQIIANPPTTLDSSYATVDLAVTQLRAELDSIRSHLDSAYPEVSAQTVSDRLHAARRTVPQVPAANHKDIAKPPTTFVLEQNYPNPFNATTTLRYAVPKDGLVKLAIYNIMGQVVATLVNGQERAGYHTVTWDGSNVASGVYLYRLEVQGHNLTHKMLLLK